MIFGGPGYITQRTKGGFMVMPITMTAICAECVERHRRGKRPIDINLCSVGLKGDWCLLKNRVWEQVWPRTSQKSVYTKMPMKHNLCIEHIEKRIGRRLTRDDFDLRSGHNKPDNKRRQFPMSKRLRNRLR